jgi:hypothetical protein
MALPTIEKDWRFQHLPVGGTGNGTNDYKDFFLKLKRILTNYYPSMWRDVTGAFNTAPLACTVDGSSNAVVANASDNWNSESDIVRGGEAQAKSWIVLGFPGISATAQLCFSYTGGSYPALAYYPEGGAYGTGFLFSHKAGFNVAVATTTVPPIGNSANIDVVQIWGRGTTPAISKFFLGNLPTATSWSGWLHAMRSTDGSCNRIVFYYNGVPLFFFMLDVPKQPFVTSTPHTWNVDDVPWFGAVIGAASAAENTLLMATTPGYWIHDSNQLFSRICSAVNPTVRTIINPKLGCEAYNGATPLTSGFNIASEIDATYPMQPMSLISIATGYRGRLGFIFDMWNVNPNLLEGDSFPSDGSQQFIVMGDFAFPWDRQALQAL